MRELRVYTTRTDEISTEYLIEVPNKFDVNEVDAGWIEKKIKAGKATMDDETVDEGMIEFSDYEFTDGE